MDFDENVQTNVSSRLERLAERRTARQIDLVDREDQIERRRKGPFTPELVHWRWIDDPAHTWYGSAVWELYLDGRCACPVCGDRELRGNEACSWCDRTGLDHMIDRPAPRGRPPKAVVRFMARLKGARKLGARKLVAAGGTMPHEIGRAGRVLLTVPAKDV